jgi:hypothetical protein
VRMCALTMLFVFFINSLFKHTFENVSLGSAWGVVSLCVDSPGLGFRV